MRKNILIIIAFFLTGCAAQIHSSRGHALLDKEKVDKAIKEFNLALQSNKLPGTYCGLYQAYLFKKDLEKAEYYLFQGLTLFPKDTHLNYQAGMYFITFRGEYDMGIDYLKKSKETLHAREHWFRDHIDSLILEAERKKEIR